MMKLYLKLQNWWLLLLVLVTVPATSVYAEYAVNGEQSMMQQQQRKIKVNGIIKDAMGEPMTGATVTVKGSTIGTTSDLSGAFSLEAPIGSTLSFSFIGYKNYECVVNQNMAKGLSVVLQEEQTLVDEVVVVGYGTQKKATLSGSVTSVKGSEILKSPQMNVSNSLAGTMPGLVVIGKSGEPGKDGSTIYIRGQSSLNDNSPLVVVDGVPNRSLDHIDPATIESISVLKDASAAIYGSQAANGVILVTTKRGKEGKVTIDASYRATWARPTRIPELTNAAEYATLVNEVHEYKGEGKFAYYSEEDIRKYADGSDPWGHPNTDWFDEILKPWNLQHNANVTMSGGNDRLKAYVSLSTRSQDGVFHNSASKYAQHDIRANIDGKINKYVSLSVDASFSLGETDAPVSNAASIFRYIMTARPTLPAYWPDGRVGPPLDLQTKSSPVIQGTKANGYNNNESYVFNVNGKLDILIPWVEGLKFTGKAAFDRGIDYSKKFSKQYTLYSWDGTTMENGVPALTEGLYGGSPALTQSTSLSKRSLLSAMLDYNRTFGIHSFSGVVGMEGIKESSNWYSAERRNFTTNFPDEMNFGDPTKQYANGSNPGENRWLNYFGRLNYTLDNKYIAEFVWRYQGSSKFLDKRWGFFPGVSLAYRISEENFWQNSKVSKVINDFKLRASWGRTGNDLIAPYQFLAQYDLYQKNYVTQNFVTNDGNNPTYIESLAPNKFAQWEEANQFNIGADMSFLNGRLILTADYFNNLRSKILIPQTSSVPEFTGLTGILPDINLGKVRNRGFDFQLGWRDTCRDFTYSITLNGGHAQNKVEFFDEAPNGLPWQTNTDHPMHSGLYYKAIGIFHTAEDLDKYPHMENARPGDIIFEDVNGDEQINGEDMVRIHKSSVPTWTGGLNLYFKYKGFDLSALFQGQAGAVRYVKPLGSATAEINYFKSFYDKRWTEDNPYAEYPRTFDRDSEYWVSSSGSNTFWLRKTDFIRLKNLEFGYTLPAQLVSKMGLQNLRLSFTATNLFTYAPDMPDFDPELDFSGGYAGEAYPIQKMLTLGVSIQF